MTVENQSWDFENDLDKHFQLSDEEIEVQKLAHTVQGHMVIALIMNQILSHAVATTHC